MITSLTLDCAAIARQLLQYRIFLTHTTSPHGFFLARHRRTDSLQSPSPFYIDLRECIAFPDLRSRIADALADRIDSAAIDLIAGVPEGAQPLAALVADRLAKPLLVIRSGARTKRRQLIGRYQPGQRVGLIEDVVTTGGSLGEIVERFVAYDIRIECAWAVIDRQAGARELLAQMGIPLQALMTVEQIIAFYERERLLPDEVIRACRRYIDSTA